MTHTPGPWEMVKLSGVGGPCAIRMVYKPPSGRTFYGVQAIFRDEDARLIAAAPELLASLKETLEAASFMANIIVGAGLTKKLDPEMGNLSGFGTRANAAIAKAEKGETT